MSDLSVEVNGRPLTLPAPASVTDAVAAAGGQRRGKVAVARNGEVVPRSAWDSTVLADGDRLEVVAAIQGGSR